MYCRFCNTELKQVFLDLGSAPPTNAYLDRDELNQSEKKYPLKIFVCHKCKLVQTEDYVRNSEMFTKNYAYFSSVSSSWLEHASRYVQMIVKRLHLGKKNFVIEVASNDGYLLKNFVDLGIPCLGIEPTDCTADAAEELGIKVRREFFGEQTARQLVKEELQGDLLIGNNVYAHVPNINDFTAGLKIALKPEGTITLEFTHILNIIKFKLFDTIYHEHYSYYSLANVLLVFQKAGLRVFDVEKIPTQGGSLRIYGCHEDDKRDTLPAVQNILDEEREFGLHDISTYSNFQMEANKVTQNLLDFLEHEKLLGKTIAAYGAAAKGNTLLNYAKIDSDLISFVCDAAPSKQGKYMPGNHIPILHPSELEKHKPDWVIILPWNLANEITEQLEYIYDWGGKFLVPLPELKIMQNEARSGAHV